MAIGRDQLIWLHGDGTPVPDNSLHAVLGPGRIGDGDAYALLFLRNTHPSFTLTAVTLWTVQDAAGGAFAIALALGPHTPGAVISAPPLATLSYSAPTAKASGITVADIPAGSQVAIGVQRNLTTAAAAYPEQNRIVLGGTSPI